MIGGAAGYLAETFDGGGTWALRSVAGSAAVTAIGGSRFRTLVAAGTALYERSLLNDNDFVAVNLEGGQELTGDITDISQNVDGDYNLLALVTDDGEIALGKSFAPNS